MNSKLFWHWLLNTSKIKIARPYQDLRTPDFISGNTKQIRMTSISRQSQNEHTWRLLLS